MGGKGRGGRGEEERRGARNRVGEAGWVGRTVKRSKREGGREETWKVVSGGGREGGREEREREREWGGGFCQVTFWALIDLFPALHYDAVALLIARV